MEELEEMISVKSPEGRKTLEDVRNFLIWAYNGEFKKSEIVIKKSKIEGTSVSLYVPKGIKTDFLALAINYAVQKGITKGISYYTNESVCFLDKDTEDIKTYLSNNKTNEL